MNTATSLDRYEIVREIGRGANAVVYLARHSALDKLVALKELVRIEVGDETAATRFLREAQLAARLTHPNIVTVYDYFEHDGTPYIAMEHLERGSLRPFVGRLTLAEIFNVLEGLLAALACAERHGVVHRDLKPENLMLTDDGEIKIADFGIAKATAATTNLTRTGLVVGAPAYMAPEQASGKETGSAADLYSAGIIAYELVTGTVPYSGADPVSILWRHVHEPLPALSLRKPDVDSRLARWIERLLEKDPSRRPAAREALDELRAIRDEVLERPRPVLPPRRIVGSLLSPLNVAVAVVVAVAAAFLDTAWLFPIAAAAYAALVAITYVSAPARAVETRDETGERPWRERAPASRSFEG
ncbi:MAG TPA: serine/threonine-protein kinase [Gaiellaceae bacterium]